MTNQPTFTRRAALAGAATIPFAATVAGSASAVTASSAGTRSVEAGFIVGRSLAAG